jgi:hypothetical protein
MTHSAQLIGRRGDERRLWPLMMAARSNARDCPMVRVGVGSALLLRKTMLVPQKQGILLATEIMVDGCRSARALGTFTRETGKVAGHSVQVVN